MRAGYPSTTGRMNSWQALAVLIPAAKFDWRKRLARGRALAALKRQRGGPLTDTQAMELCLEAQRWAREEGAAPSKVTGSAT